MNNQKLEELEKIIKTDYSNTVGIVALKDGKKLYESYFNGYTAKNTTHIFSVTKSVFSILIGIAIDKGYIKSVNQKVLEFFPDYKILPNENTISKITIENLLTMTAPYKYAQEPYIEFFASCNPIEDALDLLGGDKPIGNFNYSGIGGTHILSGILSNATKKFTFEFAKENLFEPLDIFVPHSIVIENEQEHIKIMNDKNTSGWVVDPQGNNMASWGLFLKPTDMAKIGQLFLNKGLWNENQIVSSNWVDCCTSFHSQCEEFGLNYGYLWWLIDKDSFAAMGDGGNVIYVNPKQNIVVSIASLFVEDAKIRIELIKNHIEPLLQNF